MGIDVIHRVIGKAGVIQVENNRTVIVPDLERLETACEIDN